MGSYRDSCRSNTPYSPMTDISVTPNKGQTFQSEFEPVFDGMNSDTRFLSKTVARKSRDQRLTCAPNDKNNRAERVPHRGTHHWPNGRVRTYALSHKLGLRRIKISRKTII